METNTSEMEEKLRLTSLPPEVTEHIISMLPSLSLHNLPPLPGTWPAWRAER